MSRALRVLAAAILGVTLAVHGHSEALGALTVQTLSHGLAWR